MFDVFCYPWGVFLHFIHLFALCYEKATRYISLPNGVSSYFCPVSLISWKSSVMASATSFPYLFSNSVLSIVLRLIRSWRADLYRWSRMSVFQSMGMGDMVMVVLKVSWR